YILFSILLVHQRFKKAKQRGFKDDHGALSSTFTIIMLLLILLAVLLSILTLLIRRSITGNWTISKLQSSLGEDCFDILSKSLSCSLTCKSILPPWKQARKIYYWDLTFQRHTSTPTGSSGHNESSSLYVELRLTDSEVESDEDVPRIDAGVPDEGQAEPNPASQPLPSPVVHARANLEHMDLEVTDVSTQPYLEQMDKRFTATAYPKVQENLKLTVEEQVSKAVDEIVTDAVDWAIQAPLRNRFRDFPEADIKEILHQRMWETNSYKTHKDHMMLYEALEKSMNRDHTEELLKDLAEASKKKKKSRDSHNTPPGSPPHQPPLSPPAGPSGTSGSPGASGSSQVPPPPPPPPSTNQEDIGNAHIPKVNLWQDWCKPLEEDRPATPEPAWSIPSSDLPVLKNNWATTLMSIYSPPPEDSLLAQTGPAFELVKVFHPNVIHLQYQMEECHKLLTDNVDNSIIRHNVSKPLPLGGSPGQMKAAYYPDVGLEQMVPDQMWIEEECKHTSEGDRRAVRTHMQILTVVRIEVFSMYGAVTFQDRYGVQMIMLFNEIHKFSDGTLHQIDEAMDYRVKEFKVNRINPGLNTRFGTRKDVDRSKEFMFAIQKRLKTRRIFHNLESFVGGRVRDGDYRLLECTE
nr:hypothetical protein [Tanacetum cinerariifolium]